MNSPRLILAAFVVAAACKSQPGPAVGASSQGAPLVDTLRVELGKSAAAAGGRLVATFAAQLGDSRCPANATCVWMGDAAVRIVARVGRTSVDRVVHTGVEPRNLTVDRYTIAVVGLLPYPGTGVKGTPTVLLEVRTSPAR
jgi:hypothetical protein